MKKILKLLLKPKYTFVAVCNLILDRALAPLMSDKLFLKLKYLLIMGKWPNIDHPATFNEKLQWLKINDRKSIYTTMVDKYEAKKYVSNLIGEEHIIPTLGVWDQVEDIDFDSLPNQFVLKVSHDSGGLCICRDKTTFDREKAIKILRKALNRDYFLQNREWPYKNVKRRIIAEQFLSGMGGGKIISCLIINSIALMGNQNSCIFPKVWKIIKLLGLVLCHLNGNRHLLDV